MPFFKNENLCGAYYSATTDNCEECPKGSYCDGSEKIYPCPLNPLTGTSVCCDQSGTYQDIHACYICPQPQFCAGGTICTGNREGFSCMKCIPNYYTIDGDECVPCPKSAIGQWILAFILIFICLYTVHKLLKEEFSEEEENDNEDDEKPDEVNNNDANKKKMKRQKS